MVPFILYPLVLLRRRAVSIILATSNSYFFHQWVSKLFPNYFIIPSLQFRKLRQRKGRIYQMSNGPPNEETLPFCALASASPPRCMHLPASQLWVSSGSQQIALLWKKIQERPHWALTKLYELLLLPVKCWGMTKARPGWQELSLCFLASCSMPEICADFLFCF